MADAPMGARAGPYRPFQNLLLLLCASPTRAARGAFRREPRQGPWRLPRCGTRLCVRQFRAPGMALDRHRSRACSYHLPVLGELRDERRSERTRIAAMADVRSERELGAPYRQGHHAWPDPEPEIHRAVGHVRSQMEGAGV